MSGLVRVRQSGGPEVLVYEEAEVGHPGPGQLKVRQYAAGVNYIDTYYRSGLYKSPVGLPFIPGNEAAGEVTEVGPDVSDFAVGDRIAFVETLGAYAQERLLAAARAVKLPSSIDFQQAAAMMLKGMTAEYLLNRIGKIGPGSTILVHAAAGGVGLILSQWAKALGATVIGTVGSEEKGQLAHENGCDHLIYYRREDFPTRVREITGGAMCDVVYDGIGKDTFIGSLDSLRPLGMFASFGNASGPIEPVDINLLRNKGSLFMTRPTLSTYTAKRADLLAIAGNLFDVVSSGKVKVPVKQVFDLKDAAQAHVELEQRQTTGSTILTI